MGAEKNESTWLIMDAAPNQSPLQQWWRSSTPPRRGIYAAREALEMPHLTPVRPGQRAQIPQYGVSRLKYIIAKMNNRDDLLTSGDYEFVVHLRAGKEPEKAAECLYRLLMRGVNTDNQWMMDELMAMVLMDPRYGHLENSTNADVARFLMRLQESARDYVGAVREDVNLRVPDALRPPAA